MSRYFNKSVEEVTAEFNTNISNGLLDLEVEKRISENGYNKLEGKKEVTLLRMFLDQFKNVLLVILIIAGVVSFFLGERLEAIAIFVIIILNSVLGVYQERKASDALKALKALSVPTAKVIRNSKVVEVSSKDVVVGDIVVLEAGDCVCADLRIITSTNLKINESTLTGESLPSEKSSKVINEDNIQIADMTNMAFMDSVVTNGRAKGIVVAVGMDSEIGKIARMLINVETELTPLQRKLDGLGKKLGIICFAVCLSIFLIGLLRGIELFEIFMISVSLAVAAIPSGLTIVVTVILAIGMQKLVKSNAIIKTLGAVETLGSATVICSDKTGTLTQNKMSVVSIFDGKKIHEIRDLKINNLNTNLKILIEGLVLCNDAIIDDNKMIGDPTEGALISLGLKYGINSEKVNLDLPRIDEIPFDSNRKLMSTLHTKNEELLMYTKGAFDELLKRCKYINDNGNVRKITSDDLKIIEECNHKFATDALRCLGLAYNTFSSHKLEETDLVFVGLVGMIDPPREEVKNAINLCKKANVGVKMITGDHKLTAFAIAKKLGIAIDFEEVIDGSEIDALNDEELSEVVKQKNVYARVSPEHKVRLVKMIKLNDNVVAMTGDGVNDAPSLKQADIGIAMGITGTDVSKEAADMILTDDNFSSIVKAVEEGRNIYNNIRKVVAYLLSCNIGEIMIIFIATLIGLPIPLGAIQLISINIVTDTFPSFALGLEKKESDVMDKPPRDPNENLVDKGMIKRIVFQSISLTIGALGSFMIAYYYIDPDVAKTFCFVTLVLGELLRAYSTRSETISLFKLKVFENSYLNKTVLFSLTFLLIAVYVPYVNNAFGMQALSLGHFVLASAFALIPLFGGELSKKLN
ncbi:MAG: calcium-translocating P-type ATPase, PMCA-type [Bacilli bacterium]